MDSSALPEPKPTAIPALRDLAEREILALFEDELGRRNAEWSRTLESLKQTLAELERSCETAAGRLAANDRHPSADVPRVLETLVAAAAVEVEAAEQRTRVEAQTEVDRLQALVKQTRSEGEQSRAEAEQKRADLAAERHALNTAREELEKETRARKSAEAAQEKAQTIHHLVVSDLATQLQSAHAALKADREEIMSVKQQLEAEQAERARLVAALQTVQRAVLFADAAGPRPDPQLPPSPGNAGDNLGELGDGHGGEAVEASSNDGVTAVMHLADAPVENRALRLVSTRESAAEPHPELVEYVKQLLADIESIYWSDLQSDGSAANVVDRLTANLRYAHTVFARRLAAHDVRETTLFEEQIALLLDTKPDTSFARHLAIAAYDYSLPQTITSSDRRAEAS